MSTEKSLRKATCSCAALLLVTVSKFTEGTKYNRATNVNLRPKMWHSKKTRTHPRRRRTVQRLSGRDGADSRILAGGRSRRHLVPPNDRKRVEWLVPVGAGSEMSTVPHTPWGAVTHTQVARNMLKNPSFSFVISSQMTTEARADLCNSALLGQTRESQKAATSKLFTSEKIPIWPLHECAA